MLKLRFSNLSDADFEFEEGERENMMNNLALKLNKTKEELMKLFNELQKY
ncbi:general stress protein CsbD [Marinigracilibium pacificum]|uniref:General stress protein CsbD n=1 Tax=Marinigracilibium pacificum TaxID=2729599 RepID=A0A848J628_9BACT|nr:general stress protein CsbD [Marinigracilibium pacificum]NMM49829.1 general stress protein CsbD [Marinigracilibium pacificum]